MPDFRTAVKLNGIPQQGLAFALTTVTTAYTATATDSLIIADGTSGAFTVTLPTAAGITGRVYTVKKASTDVSSNNITVATTSAQTIDGNTTSTLSRHGQAVTVMSDGSNWQVIGSMLLLNVTSSNIQPLGTQAAGAMGQAADAKHVHAMPTLNQITAPTAAVAMNTQKITGLANGTASTDAAAYGQVPLLDTTAADFKADGIAAAGSTGKAADAGHVHPLPSTSLGTSAPYNTAVANTETVVLKLPVLPANIVVGSSFIARITGSWTNTVTTGNAIWTVRAGTNGTTSDTSVATFTQGTSGNVNSGVLLQLDFLFTVTATGATGTINGVATSLQAGGGYAAQGTALHQSVTTTGWATTTATFLTLTFASGAATSSFTPLAAYLSQVA